MGIKAFSPEFGRDSADVEVDLASALRRIESESKSSKNILAKAEILRRTGDTSAAEIELVRAERNAGDAGWIAWARGNAARQTGRLAAAILHYREALCVIGLQPGKLRFYARAGLAETVRVAGDFRSAEPMHESLLNEAIQENDPRAVVWAKEGLAQISRNLGDYSNAETLFKDCVWLSERSKDYRGLAFGLRGCGDAASLQGDHRGGLKLVRTAISMFAKSGALQSLAYCYKAETDILIRLGSLDEAAHSAAIVVDLFNRTNDSRGMAFANLNLARLAIARGHWDATFWHGQSARTGFVQNGVRHGLHRTEWVLGEWNTKRKQLLVVAP